jgi:hypothetical protein
MMLGINVFGELGFLLEQILFFDSESRIILMNIGHIGKKRGNIDFFSDR